MFFKKRYAVEGLLEDGTWHRSATLHRRRVTAQRVAEVRTRIFGRTTRVIDTKLGESVALFEDLK